MNVCHSVYVEEEGVLLPGPVQISSLRDPPSHEPRLIQTCSRCSPYIYYQAGSWPPTEKSSWFQNVLQTQNYFLNRTKTLKITKHMSYNAMCEHVDLCNASGNNLSLDFSSLLIN